MNKIFLSIIGFIIVLNCYSQEVHNINYTLNDVLWLKKQEANAQPKSNSTLKYYKIAFHIVRASNGTGGVEESKIYEALNFMNELYIGANVQFYICGGFDYIDSDTYFNFQMSTEYNLRMAYNISDAINVYLFNTMASGTEAWYGYTYLPIYNTNIVALRNSTLENLSTITHEFGHFFGLPHTHNDFGSNNNEFVDGSNCHIAGDFFCDTPADPKLDFIQDVNESCIYTGGKTDENGDPYNPATDLIMSYARHRCRTRFSQEQLNSINYWANQSVRTCFSHMTVLENTNITSNQTINNDFIFLKNINIINNAKVVLKSCVEVELTGDSEIALGATLDIQ